MKTSQIIFTAALAAAALTTAAWAQSSAPLANPAPNQVVYVPQLPSPSDLTGAASAQGLSVAKIVQASDGITVTYKSASGQMNVISYRPLSAAESDAVAPGTAPAASGPATTTVVYGSAGPAYYPAYGYPAYGYYPWGWYPPVSVRLGFGFGFHGRFR